MRAGHRKRIIFKADIERPLAPLTGCGFHMRRSIAALECAFVEPSWQLFAPGRFVAKPLRWT